MNWVPQITLMCGSRDSRNTRNGGLYPNVKGTILSSLIWGVVYCWYYRKERMSGNSASAGLGTVAATPATVSLIVDIFCGG